MENFTFSERIYIQGKLMNTYFKTNDTLDAALNVIILRMEHLMQKQEYNPVDALDVSTLRNMVELTIKPEVNDAAPLVAPVLAVFNAPIVKKASPSNRSNNVRKTAKVSPKKTSPKSNKASPSKKIAKAVQQFSFFDKIVNSPRTLRKYGSTISLVFGKKSRTVVRKS